MIEKFNNIFYLTIYLVHFAGTGVGNILLEQVSIKL